MGEVPALVVGAALGLHELVGQPVALVAVLGDGLVVADIPGEEGVIEDGFILSIALLLVHVIVDLDFHHVGYVPFIPADAVVDPRWRRQYFL